MTRFFWRLSFLASFCPFFHGKRIRTNLIPLEFTGFSGLSLLLQWAHFCDCRTPKRCRRKNGILNARPLRCRIHAENLHPRHPPKAGASHRKDGKFHGQGHVSVGQARKTAGTSYPEVSSRFRLFPRVGHRVGQDRRQPNPYRTTPNRMMRKHPQYSEKYAKRKQHRNKATLC